MLTEQTNKNVRFVDILLSFYKPSLCFVPSNTDPHAASALACFGLQLPRFKASTGDLGMRDNSWPENLKNLQIFRFQALLYHYSGNNYFSLSNSSPSGCSNAVLSLLAKEEQRKVRW